jgi:demethylmenaquinone methyltransferase/2-methoxy-6-polyprenyl-1,4-benzoquinol methylase
MENQKGKKEEVRTMFNNIAHRYDFLNHFLSVGIDKIWRKKVIKILASAPHDNILDVATGTGDLAIAESKLKVKSITGVDISEGMLEIGKKKVQKLGLDNIIKLETGDSENLRFEDGTFDALTVAFGVRNFENLDKGLREMLRVIKPGGRIIILEFSQPVKFPIKQLYGFYFKRILPGLGKLISKDKGAYTYLPESVNAFPFGNDFLKRMEDCGYKKTWFKSLTFGIASIYIGEK